MNRPVEVRAMKDYRIWVAFENGESGEVDLSDLVGKGVFSAFQDSEFFARVKLGPGNSLAWSGDIELCPDAVYMRLTGKKPEQVFDRLAMATNA